MRYPYTFEEVKVNDTCILVWSASKFGEFKDDAPKGKKGETTYGELHFDDGKVCLVPVVVTDVSKEWVRLRPYILKDGEWKMIYNDRPEPMSLDIMNNDKVFSRLIKTKWCELKEITDEKI